MRHAYSRKTTELSHDWTLPDYERASYINRVINHRIRGQTGAFQHHNLSEKCSEKIVKYWAWLFLNNKANFKTQFSFKTTVWNIIKATKTSQNASKLTKLTKHSPKSHTTKQAKCQSFLVHYAKLSVFTLFRNFTTLRHNKWVGSITQRMDQSSIISN